MKSAHLYLEIKINDASIAGLNYLNSFEDLFLYSILFVDKAAQTSRLPPPLTLFLFR